MRSLSPRDVFYGWGNTFSLSNDRFIVLLILRLLERRKLGMIFLYGVIFSFSIRERGNPSLLIAVVTVFEFREIVSGVDNHDIHL